MELTFTRHEITQELNGDYRVTLIVSKNQKQAVGKLIETLKDNVKEMVLSIAKPKKKRSKDANSYLWILCQAIAEKTGSTKEIVYIENVKAVGQFEILPVRNEAVESWISIWKRRGLGWYSEVIDGCKIEGYTKTINYYGSSVYDTKSMSVLVDNVVFEATNLGIETESPESIVRLKEMWK